MNYIGMPMGMWTLFASSFRSHLETVFGMEHAAAKAVTRKAAAQYRGLIRDLPAFEREDRFQMNIVNCAMLCAFVLSMPERPDVQTLTDYYAASMMTPPCTAALSPGRSCSIA